MQLLLLVQEHDAGNGSGFQRQGWLYETRHSFLLDLISSISTCAEPQHRNQKLAGVPFLLEEEQGRFPLSFKKSQAVMPYPEEQSLLLHAHTGV